MKIIKILIVNILVFLFLLILAEIGARLFYPNYVHYKRTFPGEFENRSFGNLQTKVMWPKVDKKFGWVCKNSPNIRFVNPLYFDQKIKYSIDSNGFRFHKTNILDTTKKIMVLGDSFVFGVYLSDTSTIPYYLEKFSGRKSYNLGIPGWGIDQMYLSFLSFYKEIKPQTILLFYIDDDINRINEAYRFGEGMNKPCFTISGDSIVYRENDKSIYENVFQKSRFLNPLYKWFWQEKAIQLSKQIFIQIRKRVGNINFYIIHIPQKEQVLFPEKYSKFINKEFFINNQINYIYLNDYFTQLDSNTINALYLKNDEHLSNDGTKLTAKIVSEILLKNYDN